MAAREADGAGRASWAGALRFTAPVEPAGARDVIHPVAAALAAARAASTETLPLESTICILEAEMVGARLPPSSIPCTARRAATSGGEW